MSVLSILLLASLAAAGVPAEPQVARAESPKVLANDDDPVPGSPDGPSIRFAENEVDQGDLLQGEIVERELVIHNDGDLPLLLSKATPSCGCTTVISFPPRIAPGDQGVLRFEINSKKIKPGPGRKRILLDTNDLLQPKAGYYFTVNVVALYQSEPSDIRLGGLFDGEKRAKIRLVGASKYGFELESASSRGGMFEIEEFFYISEGVYELTLLAPAVDAPATTRDPLDLVINVKDGRQIQVGQWVNLDHWNPITVVPEGVLLFGNRDTDPLLVEGAKPVTKMVTLRARDPKATFKILSVKLEGVPDGSFGTNVMTLTEGMHYSVAVSLPAYRTESYLNGELIIETDAAIEPIRKLKLRAMFGRKR